MYPQVLLKNRKEDRILTVEEYREMGGYEALEEALGADRYRPGDIQETLLEAELLGRGGAAFPMGKKMATVPESRG